MKNKILFLSSLLAGCILVIAACQKIEDNDSVVTIASVPYNLKFINDAYVYGQGQTSIYTDLPDVIAIAIDTLVGFEGGYGGKTGMDSLKVFKSEIVFPDTVGLGGKAVSVEKFNKANLKTVISTNIVIAGPIANPGPTALEGTYVRPLNGVEFEIKKVFDGVYVIDNPGGAVVAPFPYLLYNHASSSGTDSIAFPIQPNECGGGLQLVGPGAPFSLTAADYASQYPPSITAPGGVVTLSWRVFTYSSASQSAVQPGNGGLCTWGVGVRTFEKL